jgi:8-amino-7-oxononanoate synthase
MDQKLKNKLEKRKEEGTLRSLSHFEGFSDFYSNDYFGFSRIATTSEGKSYGSTGSRLISGNSIEASACEVFLAEFFKSEGALFFNSGYDANLGLFSSVPQRGDTVLYDEAIHASIRDGIRLSNAHSFSFVHSDIMDLRTKMAKSSGTVYIAVEGLYSMDGDLSPLRLIADLAAEHGAYLIVDEAHSAGVLGDSGRGVVDLLGIRNKVFARVVTFGKAYGSHGAAVLGEKALIGYLVNFARSFIYTTALPPSEYERVQKVVGSDMVHDLQKELHKKIRLFREGLSAFKPVSDERSPIQMIRLGNVEKTRLAAGILNDYKLGVKPIFSPTVKPGQEGIRICLHSTNSDEEIAQLLHVLNNFEK